MPLFPVSRKKQSAFDCFFDLLVRCLIKTQELDIHADCVQNAGFVKLMTLQKYKTSGVREYWIVDPDSRQVFVYDFDHSDVPAMYPFSAQIPILLSEGKCTIDFAKISEAINELNL